MTSQPRRLQDLLSHIVDAIERIQQYTSGVDASAFHDSLIIQDAVIRNFEVIGEASRNIERAYPDFATAHPELPLSIAYDMRNALAHGYFSVDLDVVWRTISSDLPGMLARVLELLHELRR